MVLAVLVSLAATLVAGAFAWSLLRQWRAKRRHHALAWAISLALFAGGTLAIALGVGLGWSYATFGTYWLLGALLTVPFLAVGQLHLMAPKLAAFWWTFAGLFTAWAVLGMLLSPPETAVFAAVDAVGGIPVGREAWGEGALAISLLRPSNYVAAIVIVGSIWSGFRTKRWGVLLIALGVIVAALSFGAARGFEGETQAVATSLTLAVGVGIMYGGFLAAGRPSRRSSFTEAPARAT